MQGVEVGEGGDVRFQFLLRPEDPGDLVKEARAAVEAIEGVGELKINVQLPQMAAWGRRLRGARVGAVSSPDRCRLPRPSRASSPTCSHVIAVSSGKGGVGKSMVAANLAAAFAKDGLSVGLLDADIYGPNIPLMFGVQRRPERHG